MIIKKFQTRFICDESFCKEEVTVVSPNEFKDNDLYLIRKGWVFYTDKEGNEKVLCILHKHRKKVLEG